MAIPFSKNINNLNNDYPKLLDQVISQSQILRCGNSRVMPYCRNRSLSIKISLNKKELNFQYLTCNISDGSNFKFRLLNCQMPVVTEYEAIKMSKEVEAVTEIAKILPEEKTEFYVGQLVESYNNGKGTVTCIDYKLTDPVMVVFDNHRLEIFSLEGQYLASTPLKYRDIRPLPEVSEDKPMTAINQETSDEIDIHQCLDEALIQIRNPPEKQPLYTGTMAKIINRGLNRRMIANDTNPTPLAMKPVPEKTELTAKCALCGEPCKPRNGAKFYSHCVGGCK